MYRHEKSKGRKIRGLLKNVWDIGFAIIKVTKIISMIRSPFTLNKNLKKDLAIFLSSFPRAFDIYLTPAISMPKSVIVIAITTKEMIKEYNPKSSGRSSLARIMVKRSPPIFEIIIELKL